MTPEFLAWPKIPRWDRPVTITEKIDGTNAAVVVYEDEHGVVHVGAQSRTRIITPGKSTDNFGFAAWVAEHEEELGSQLGLGHHYGEWYGAGIQRGYGLEERRFALFNVDRWKADNTPACCDVVPVLGRCDAGHAGTAVYWHLNVLHEDGSVLVPGFMKPEGVVIFHHAGRHTYKALLEGDDKPKGIAA